MIVEEMSREECSQVLAEARLARLACAADNQPYVVPMYLVYHQAPDGEDCLYGFTTIGQKVEWMRANPLVCVEVDEVSSRTEWVSVVAFGRYEELPIVHEPTVGRAPTRSSTADWHEARAAASEYANEQLFARQLLEARAMWWEPAYTVRTEVVRGGRPSDTSPVFYKIHLTQMTGDRARREQVAAPAIAGAATLSRFAHAGWLQKSLSRWRRGFRSVEASVRNAGIQSIVAEENHNAR
jgi:hypothetical protein